MQFFPYYISQSHIRIHLPRFLWNNVKEDVHRYLNLTGRLKLPLIVENIALKLLLLMAIQIVRAAMFKHRYLVLVTFYLFIFCIMKTWAHLKTGRNKQFQRNIDIWIQECMQLSTKIVSYSEEMYPHWKLCVKILCQKTPFFMLRIPTETKQECCVNKSQFGFCQT